MRRASNVLVASAMTMWIGCSDIEKLTDAENEERKARQISLSAESFTVPVNGATDVEVTAAEADGQPVKDGTNIEMSATRGRIEPADVRTRGGRARVAYRASGTPGAATVTASSGSARAELTITVQESAAAGPSSGPPRSATFDIRQVTWLDADVSAGRRRRWSRGPRSTIH